MVIGNDKVPGVTVAEGWGEGQDHQREMVKQKEPYYLKGHMEATKVSVLDIYFYSFEFIFSSESSVPKCSHCTKFYRKPKKLILQNIPLPSHLKCSKHFLKVCYSENLY